MPGNGTFNLTALWRALGIKNPEPSVRESIQPVIVVGQFSQLTPQYRPPTAVFGGNVPAVGGEKPIIQVISRGLGGSLLGAFSHESTNAIYYAERAAPLAGFTNRPPAWLQSRDPVLSVVEVGNDPANPGSNSASPSVTDFPGAYNYPLQPFWLAPGGVVVFWSSVAGSALSNWSMQLTDLPASDPPAQ